MLRASLDQTDTAKPSITDDDPWAGLDDQRIVASKSGHRTTLAVRAVRDCICAFERGFRDRDAELSRHSPSGALTLSLGLASLATRGAAATAASVRFRTVTFTRSWSVA